MTYIQHALTRLIPLGRFAKGAALIASGAVLGQLLGFAVAPLLTRLYSPEDFGILGAYAALIGILATVASLRYEAAIPLPEEDSDAASILVLSLLCTLVVGAALGLGVLFLGSSVAQWLGQPDLETYLWLVPLAVVLIGVTQVFTQWAVRKQSFGPIAATKFNQGVGMAATQAGLGFLNLGALGLLLGDLMGRIAGSASLVSQAWKNDGHLIRGFTKQKIQTLAKKYKHFPLLSGPSSLLNSAGIQLPTLLLAIFFGPVVAGLYTLGQRMVWGGLSLVSQSVGQVYVSKLASLRDNALEQRQLLIRTSLKLLKLIAVPMVALAVVAPPLFALVFGEQWRMAGEYVRILCPALALAFVVVPVSQTLNVLERQDLQLGWDITRLALVAGSLVGAKSLGLNASESLLMYSIISSFSYILLWGLSLWVFKQKETV